MSPSVRAVAFRRPWSRSARGRLVLVVVVAVALALPATAGAATIASATIGSATDTNVPGRAQDYRVTAGSSGSVDRLNVYLDGANSASVVALGLFTSKDSTHAGTLLARCDVSTTVRNAWNRCSIPSVSVVGGRTYRLTILQPYGTSGTIQYRNRTGGRTFGSASSTLTTIANANPWRNGPDWGSQTASVYADQASSQTSPPPPVPRTPADADGDGNGVPDSSDSCPSQAGPASNQGCPVPPAPPSGPCPVSTPNAPDGPDGFGGCFPGPASTGVPAGTVLTSYGGPMTVTTANTVIDSKTINGTLNIATSGVQIRNSKINGSVWIDDPSRGYSFAITDSEIDAGPVDATHNDGVSAIGKSGFVATRVETYRGIRGVWCEYNCTVQDSWIHGQDPDEGGHAHESGVRMGDGSVIRHNSLRCDAPDIAPDAGCSADLTGYGDFAPIRNNTIDRNLFLATTGGTCAYGGSSGSDGSKPYGDQAANIVFKDNVFQRRSQFESSGNCGYWFAIADFDSSRPGNQWTNNQWDTGGTVSPG